MQQHQDNSRSTADLAIVGMGPGGLAACIQAVRQGLSVVVFTDRLEYIRPQRVLVDPENIKLLKSFNMTRTPEDEAFLAELDSEGAFPQIKDIERYLLRQIHYLQLQPNAKIKMVNLAENKTTIQSIGPEEKGDCITLQDGSSYYFQHLIGADGAKHPTSNWVKEGFDLDIHYTPTAIQDPHQHHGAVSLKINPEKGAVQKDLTAVAFEDIKKKITEGRKKLEWDKPSAPAAVILYNEAQSKFTFAGEIPKAVFEAPAEMRRELLKQWAILAINCNISSDDDDENTLGVRMYIPPEALDYRESKNAAKNALMATTFEIPLVQSNQALYPLTTGFYAPIGDARRTPNYRIGHGLNDALRCGVEFVRCIRPNAVPFQQAYYQELVTKIDKDIDKKMARYQPDSLDSDDDFGWTTDEQETDSDSDVSEDPSPRIR